MNAKILHMTAFSAGKRSPDCTRIDTVNEPLWNAARANITMLGDIRQWAQVAFYAVTPVIQGDAAFRHKPQRSYLHAWDETNMAQP